MSQITMGIGVILSILGVGAFLGSTRKHVTSLIPTFLGLPLALLGVAGLKEDLKRGATIGAAGVSLIGLVVSAQGLFFPQFFPATDASTEDAPMRGPVQALTAALCGMHLGNFVRMLIQGGQDDE